MQLCYQRFPGIILLGVDQPPFPLVLKLVADQIKVGVESWDDYGQREQTRREHLELQTVFGFQPFTMIHYRQAVHTLRELVVLASALIEQLRRQSIILPAINAIERASAEAITRTNRRIYAALSEPLSDRHRHHLAELYQGDFLPSCREPWIGARREVLRQQYVWVEQRLSRISH